MEKVVIIGMGYVGFPTACAIAKTGKYEVFGLDIDESKITNINNKISPIDDKIAAEEIKHVNLTATTDSNILSGAKFILVCVPTPIHSDFTPNLGPVKGAVKSIAKILEKGQNIIIESTINPGVCDDIVIPILEESGLRAGNDFDVAHCPERINPGDKEWNIYNINRNVGASSINACSEIANFYRSFLDAEVFEMSDIKHAEATKIIENTFRDINIAYVNELAKSFDTLGLDIVEVIKGASNKPFGFMAHYPGCGVGGHCIPVDPYYLIEKAKEAGFNHAFLKTAREINNSMPEYTVNKLMLELNNIGKPLKGTKVGVLGYSYKKDVADLRETPAKEIVESLKDFGSDVLIYEPYDSSISNCLDLDDILKKSDVIILATDHTQFIDNLSKERLTQNNIKILIDGRNCLKKESYLGPGLIYKGIGR